MQLKSPPKSLCASNSVPRRYALLWPFNFLIEIILFDKPKQGGGYTQHGPVSASPPRARIVSTLPAHVTASVGTKSVARDLPVNRHRRPQKRID
jgi:hypothetical protein